MFWLIRFEPKIVTVFRGVLYIIAAIVLLIMGAINCIQLMTPAINLNDPDLDWSTLKAGQHVEMDVDFVMGAYMTTSEDGSERSRDYMIGHLGSDEDGNLYICTRTGVSRVNIDHFFEDTSTVKTKLRRTREKIKAKLIERSYVL